MTFHPAVVLLLGALFLPLFKGRARSLYVIALPVLALVAVALLPEQGNFWNHTWLAGFSDLTFLRVDKLSKAFGYLFAINAIAAFIYAFHVKDNTQHLSALLYIGSALGAIFAGDLISLYIFWEIMAVASTMLILARRSKRAYGSAFRYVLLHILGGLFFLAGIVITYHHTGTLAFDKFDPETMKHAGTWMILLGFLVNAGAPPFSAWLSDAYPEATVTGSVILSAYTTKTAVYALLRGYPGWDILIPIGCVMAIYGIIYALLENDIRRALAYAIITQIGFMVCGIGIGTEMCLDGVVAHAFCSVLYTSLLWMAAGAVLHRVGKTKFTDLGGLYRSMPWTLCLGCIGAFAISSVPLTSGFTSKTMTLAGAQYEHLFWPWIILKIASAGVFLQAGIKFPYLIFFGKDRGHQVEDAPKPMIVGMGILAFLCIAIGLYPQPLYNLLPNQGTYEFSAWKFDKVLHQIQLLLLSALAFFVWIKWLKRTDTITLDTDWFYRRGGGLFYKLCDRGLNSLNHFAKAAVVDTGVKRLARFLQHGPARLVVVAMTPIWMLRGAEGDELQAKQQAFYEDARWGAFPVGATAICAVILLALLFIF